MYAEAQQLVQTMPATTLPMVNEIAAVGLGASLANPEARTRIEEDMRSNFNDLELVYRQNTADTMHIAVPDFSCIDDTAAELSDDDLAQVVGGEILVSAIIGAIAAIGVAIGVGTVTTVVVGGVVGTVVAGSSVVAGATMLGIAAAVGVTAGTAVALGIAHGVGAFNPGGGGGGGGEQYVTISHAS